MPSWHVVHSMCAAMEHMLHVLQHGLGLLAVHACIRCCLYNFPPLPYQTTWQGRSPAVTGVRPLTRPKCISSVSHTEFHTHPDLTLPFCTLTLFTNFCTLTLLTNLSPLSLQGPCPLAQVLPPTG